MLASGLARAIYMMRALPFSVFVLAVLVTAPSAFCAIATGVATQSGQSDYRENLTIGYMQQIDSLNPHIAVNDVSRIFSMLVYDCLQTVDVDLGITPNLARSWNPVPVDDPDMIGMPFGSIWQYNLTTDAVWSDGVPFTADDIVFNVWYLSGPSTTYDTWASTPYSYFMKDAWKMDNNTVRISFWDPQTYEPTPCGYAHFLSLPILPKHMLDGFGHWDIRTYWSGVFNDTVSPGMPIVGTGPFMATESLYQDWLQGDHVTLVRNPNYHRLSTEDRSVGFESLTMRFFLDATTMTLALENGEIDAAAFPPAAYESIEDDVQSGELESVEVFNGSKVTQSFTYVGFNMNDGGPNPSRLDPIVRQALHMATNRQYIVDNYYGGIGEVGTTLIPPINKVWHYEPTADEKARFTYDLTAAAALLEANGYIDSNADGTRECSDSSPAVLLGYVPEGTNLTYELLVRKDHQEEKDIAQYLRSQWAEIGVDARILVVEEITLAGVAFSYSGDAFIWEWSGDIDPNYQLFMLSSMAINGLSDCAYRNDSYDSAYRHSANSTDEVDRQYWAREAQRICYNDSPYIILSYVHQGYAWRTDTFTGWGNWSAHPGLSIDHYWSANPLFFDLHSVDRDSNYLFLAGLGVVAASAATVAIASYIMHKKRQRERIGKAD